MTPRRLLLLLAAVSACGRTAVAPARVRPTQAQLEAPVSFKVRYSAVTEAAASERNDNYFSIVEDERLFILADAGERKDPTVNPSKLVAEALGGFARGECAEVTLEGRLTCVLRQVDTRLKGAGTASVGFIVVQNGYALMSRVGDVAVLRMSGGGIEELAFEPAPPLGAPLPVELDFRWLGLAEGDTLVLVSRGVLDTVGTDGVLRSFSGAHEVAALEAGAKALVAEGKRTPGHAELTVVVVHLVAALD